MRNLETLDAIEDIRGLEGRYARYADQKRWTDLAGLFTEDGWFRPQDAEGNEIANMAVVLCSDVASYVTGSTVMVDGAMTDYPEFARGG